MDLEGQVVAALREELDRQAQDPSTGLVLSEVAGRTQVSGVLDLEALAMAVVGAVAGGP
jgi:hypothetical protein